MRFEFYGTVKKIRESDNFKAVDTKVFESGWCKKTFRFNGFGGGSRYTFVIDDGFWCDAQGERTNKNTIYTVNKNNEFLKIPYADRFDDKYVEQVPFYKTFDIMTPEGYNVSQLENIVKKYEKGEHPSEESCEQFNIYSHEDAVRVLKKAKAAKKHYLCKGDFIDAMIGYINNDTFEGKRVKVTGEYTIRYSEQKGQFYKNFEPNKIAVSNDAHEDGMFLIGNVDFDRNAIEPIDGTKDYLVNTFVRYYDSQYRNDACKGYCACPLTLKLYGNNPATPVLLRRFSKSGFSSETEYREYTLTLKYVDGAEATEITEADLSDDEREEIACGLTTLEDIKRQHGGKVYGERVTEFRIYKVEGSPVDTAYSEKDFELPSHTKAEEVRKIVADAISTDNDADTDDDDMPFDI